VIIVMSFKTIFGKEVNSFLGWWGGSRQSSTAWLLVLLAFSMATRVLAASTGIDRLTTIDIGDAPLTYCLTTLVGVVVAMYAARNWFAPNPQEQAIPLYNLRRDRPGVWWIVGIVLGAILTIVFAWVTCSWMGIIAQYIPGQRVSIEGSVVLASPVSTPKTVCRFRVVVREDQTDRMLSICTRTSLREALGPADLSEGKHVTVYANQTILGRVALMVAPR
jgi:hypothetical protein